MEKPRNLSSGFPQWVVQIFWELFGGRVHIETDPQLAHSLLGGPNSLWAEYQVGPASLLSLLVKTGG